MGKGNEDLFKTTPEGRVDGIGMFDIDLAPTMVTCSGIPGVSENDLKTVSYEELQSETEELTCQVISATLREQLGNVVPDYVIDATVTTVMERMRDEGLV